MMTNVTEIEKKSGMTQTQIVNLIQENSKKIDEGLIKLKELKRETDKMVENSHRLAQRIDEIVEKIKEKTE